MKRPSYQPAQGFDEEHQRLYLEKYNTLRLKKVEATPIIDFTALEELGVKQQFLYLFERIGIPGEFFMIPTEHDCYADQTKEFLASVKLTETDFVEFQINGELNSVSLDQMREWFLLPRPNMTYFGYEEPENGRDHRSKAKFWYKIAGEHPPKKKEGGETPKFDPRTGNIIHPTLRMICRCLSFSMFARGETTLRPRVEEFKLMSTMLRAGERVLIPDLMRLMVKYWEIIYKSGVGGAITMGSYVTLIMKKAGMPILERTICPEAKIINMKKLISFHWVKCDKNNRSRYLWNTRVGTFSLPIQDLVDPDDELTWRLGYEGDEDENDEEGDEENDEGEGGGEEEEDNDEIEEEREEGSGEEHNNMDAGPSASRHTPSPSRHTPSPSRHAPSTSRPPPAPRGMTTAALERHFSLIRGTLSRMQDEQAASRARQQQIQESVGNLTEQFTAFRTDFREFSSDYYEFRRSQHQHHR